MRLDRSRVPSLLSCVALAAAGCAAPAPRPVNSAGARAPMPNGVRVEALAEVAGLAPAAWAFITTDLKPGHPELVLLVERELGERDDAFPTDGLEIIGLLATAVKKGRHFNEWEMAGIPEGMLGRRDLTGIILGGEVPDPRVKVGAPTMAVLLVTQDELDVAFHFGAPRVTNLLGHQGKFFPYPPWVDRRRTSVCSPAGMKSSPIAQISTRQWIRGAAAWEDRQANPRRITLQVTRAAGKQIAKVLGEGGRDKVVFFSLPPPADADARLVYTKLGQKPIAISQAKNEALKIAGAFVVLAPSSESSGAILAEDGFSVFVPEADWDGTVTSLQDGRSVDVEGRDGSLPFTVVFD